jgi:hypothetical protein
MDLPLARYNLTHRQFPYTFDWLASRQLSQSAYRNPMESNMQRNETKNKNKGPYEGKNDEQTLTLVTCS